MLGIKKQILKKIDKIISNNFNREYISNKKTSPFLLNIAINKIIRTLSTHKRNSNTTIGNLISYPSNNVVDIWKKLLPYNPGNLGNWSINKTPLQFDTKYIERQMINQLLELFHCHNSNMEGYFTSGSTEANIYSCWLGKKLLIKNGLPSDQICLLKTSLTHYSVSKSSDITFTKSYNIPLNKYFGMSKKYLFKTIEKLYKKKYYGFLIPLTLGYTLTGTNDNVENIIKTIRKIKEKYPKIHFYIWIDAAISGLILPFIKTDFSPFQYPEIQSFSSDFHKVFGVPIPSSFILYRQPLRDLIEKNIDYLLEKDNTLLGSRTGIAPVASWYFLNLKGKDQIKKHLNKLFSIKKEKLKQIKTNYPQIKIVTDKLSLNAAIIAPIKLKKELKKQYDLSFKEVTLNINNKNYKKFFSKTFFLNHLL